MEFLLWFTDSQDGTPPEAAGMAEMKAPAEQLAREGVLRRGATLGPVSDGALIRVRDGKATVHDGPFAGSREVAEGFWIVDVATRDEAIAIARRSPHARGARVEVHPIRQRFVYAGPEGDTPFLLVFRREPGLTDCDGSKLREMIAFGEPLARQGVLAETAPLAGEPPPARVEVRGGKALVTDGPFAEAKEAVGGYAVVHVADRSAAIELATRYPHARWGPVEVREILYFDPV